MDIHWVTAFLDLPDAVYDEGTRFWRAVTGTELSPPRGDRHEFATLLPATGDPYLRVQRTGVAGARIHLDLHVSSIPAARASAIALGAELLSERGHVVMRSPGGVAFCFVHHRGERTRPDPTTLAGRPHVVDQVSVDAPAEAFDAEASFWAHLTGWQPTTGALAEFVPLSRPPALPIRLLLQRLGTDHPGTEARAHLDVAAGEHVDELLAAHQQLGAEHVATYTYWTTMRDPAGLLYCLTRRDPRTGRLPG